MRYLTLTYFKKPNGQIDETLSVVKHLRLNDMQTASIVLDFKELKVLKANMEDKSITRDWDTLIGYYHQHYAATIERMFRENGWEVVKESDVIAPDSEESQTISEDNIEGA